MKAFLLRWPAHVITAVVVAFALIVLSWPEVSATPFESLNRAIDLLKRLMYVLTGALTGYWISRWFLGPLYAEKKAGNLDTSALIRFEVIRAVFILAGVIGMALQVRG